MIQYIDTTYSANTVILPSATEFFEDSFIIKDSTGFAATNNITVLPILGEQIDGLDQVLINTNFSSTTFTVSNGNWHMISNVPNRETTANILSQTIIGAVPGDDLQVIIDNMGNLGGGFVQLSSGIFNLTDDLIIPSSVTLSGVGTSGTIVDFGSLAKGLKIIDSNRYDTGTISVTSGSDAVTGSGTTWDSSMEGQQIFLITKFSAQFIPILTVIDPTTIQLAYNYVGENITDGTYLIDTPAQSAVIQNLTVQNSAVDAILVDGTNACTINNVVTQSSLTAMRVNNTNFITLSNFTSVDCDYGIYADTLTNSSVFSISSSTINVGDAMNFTRVNNSAISAWSADSAAGNGVVCNSCANIGFENFDIEDNGGVGILLDDSNQYLTFTGSGFVGFNGGDGLTINTNNIGNTFTSCQFISNGGYGANMTDNSSTTTLISTDIFSANSGGAVNDDGTDTLIRSNIGVSDN